MRGPVEVGLEGGPPLSVKGKKPRALLALLILRRNEPVPTELLIEDLWGDKAPATAANTLQVYVSQLRKLVGDRLTREGSAYRLRINPGELDAERFEQLAEEGDAVLRRRSFREAAELLGEALALWRGPALADLRYESFAQGETARLDELRLVANENRIEADLGLGRHDQVIGELDALRGATRVLTLTGPGGSGKTRLAIEAANMLAGELVDGAFFVALDAIRDPVLLLPAIAEAVAVRESGDKSLPESLAERLSGRQALLVIDNFEQLAEAAPALSEILEAAPGLSFLVTSRSALRVSGEQEYPLDPLDLQDAVALFVERAQGADPRFSLTDENTAAV